MTETPKLKLNLIEDSPPQEPKFIRSAREKTTIKLAFKLDDSPRKVGSHRNSVAPSILLTGDDTPSGQMISTNFSTKADIRITKSRRFSIDPKTSNMIDAIVQDRQSTYKNPVLKPRFDSFPKENGEFDNPTKEQKTIGKVVAMKIKKGLDDASKDKQFDAKLDIFDNVKTFVDTRQLFHDSSDEQPGSRKSSGEDTESHGSAQSNSLHAPSPRSGYLQVGKVTVKRSSFAAAGMSPKGLAAQDTFSAAVRASEEPADEEEERTDSDESPTTKRDQEIRRLYEEFKKSAIEKFGPELLERAQKKLKDPKEVKKLQKKHKEDLVKMKKLQAELEDFDFSHKLMDGLMEKKRGSVDIQKETFDTFDNHIKNGLEAEAEIVKPRLPRVSITTPVSPRISKPFEHKELKATNPEDASQIQLLLKIQEHQQKSEEIIKVLRKRLYGLDRSSVFSEGNTPKVGSQSARGKSKFLGSVETLETEPTHPQAAPLNRVPTLRKSLLKGSLKLDLGSANEFDTPQTVKSERSHGFLPAIHKDSPKAARGKSKPASPLANHKNKIMGIRDNLDSLVTNRDLNAKIRHSIKEMAHSYAVPEIHNTPDSLRLPKPEKSTSKLATSLAAQIYKDKCIHDAFKV